MSEQQKQPGQERRVYTVTTDPEDFRADAEVKYLGSSKFCGLVNDYFRMVFADYAGCFFEMGSGRPTISLVFNHCKHEVGKPYAVEMPADKKVGNSVLDRSRSFDRRVKEGDRYHITNDGSDIITKLLAPNYYNYGKPNWGIIVVDYLDRSGYAYGAGTQLTKIIGIDPVEMCKVIYGNKDEENGSWLDYDIKFKDISAPNGFGFTIPNYVLTITKAYTDQIRKTYEDLGIMTCGFNPTTPFYNSNGNRNSNNTDDEHVIAKGGANF